MMTRSISIGLACFCATALLVGSRQKARLVDPHAVQKNTFTWREPVVLVARKAGNWAVFRTASKSITDPLRALGEEVEKKGEDWPCVLLVEDRMSFRFASDFDLIADKAGFKHVWTFEYHDGDDPPYMSELRLGKAVPFLFSATGAKPLFGEAGEFGEAQKWNRAAILAVVQAKTGVVYRVDGRAAADHSGAVRLLAARHAEGDWAAVLVDSNLPLSYSRDVRKVAVDAGFEDVRVFVYGSKHSGARYMSEVSFGPSAPFSDRFTSDTLPERDPDQSSANVGS